MSLDVVTANTTGDFLVHRSRPHHSIYYYSRPRPGGVRSTRDASSATKRGPDLGLRGGRCRFGSTWSHDQGAVG